MTTPAYHRAIALAAGAVAVLLGTRLLRRSVKQIDEPSMSEADLRRLIKLSRVSNLGELAGSLAHELNQPLTAIASNAQAALVYLQAGNRNPAQLCEILEDVSDDAGRAGTMVRQIRALINGEATAFVPVEVGPVIDAVLALVHGNARSRRISLTATCAAGLPRVVGDPIQIQQVLLNLLLNAFDAFDATDTTGATSAGVGSFGSGRSAAREVCVDVCAKDDRVQVSVRDLGCGAAESELATMFEPFMTTKPHGMGLGLSISRSIVARHGGELRACNNPMGGMTFHFTLVPEPGSHERPEIPTAQTASASVDASVR